MESRIPASRNGAAILCTLILLLGSWLVCGSADAADYRIEDAPTWLADVEPVTLEASLFAQISDGVAYLLSDTQIRITPDSRDRYRRIVRTATSAVGVQYVANLEITFDPSYETLVLHSINIQRDGQIVPKVATANVQILQREPELERRIFDGGKTASIFLEDVHVGDTVDYAYSIRGRNPVFKGQDFGYFALQFQIPVGRIHSRIVAVGMPRINIATAHSDASPVVKEYADVRTYQWDQVNVAPRTYDSDAPTWYDADAGTQWSTFRDWSDVAQWAAPLYALPEKPGRNLENEIALIAREHSTSDARLLAVLRFVQHEIRYLGVVIGTGSHAPNPPDLVLERRFGDCKDKSLLMLTMLNRLGIEAQPALVHTSVRRGLAARIASPSQFDHVLVHANLDGQSIWLDPTHATQHSDLEHLTQADFDLALLVAGNSTGLTSMKPQLPAVSKQVIRTNFDLREGFDQPVVMTVVTEMEGARAESMRATLGSRSAADLAKDYLNFYANYYPSIAVGAAMDVLDDAPNNRLVTTEHYTIAEFSEPDAHSERLSAGFYAPEISGAMQRPKAAVRSSPLAVDHPLDLTLITEAHLPEEWPITPATVSVEDPGFVFERTVAYEPKRLLITYRYHSLTDAISAADTPRFSANQARARELTSFGLYWDSDTDPVTQTGGMYRFNGLLVMIAVMALGFWISLAIRLYRYDPPPASEPPPSTPVGLRGWLIIPTLGVLLTPCILIFALISVSDVWTTDTWNALTTSGSDSYDPLWAPILLFMLTAQLGMIVYATVVAIVYLQRRTSTPRLYVGLLVASALAHLLGASLPWLVPSVEFDSKEFAGSVRSCIVGLIWIAYFLKSDRVKATFRKQLRQRTKESIPSTTDLPVPQTP